MYRVGGRRRRLDGRHARADRRSSAASVEEEIDDNPNNPIAYNQWAWLIANTEGDFPKAVRYSRRSLELEPGTASFLDTLGRCYYSAGDIRKGGREPTRGGRA